MAFDRAALNEALTDIETYLGYLRGNENAWKYLREAQAYFKDNQEGGILLVVRLDEGYHFPCPDPAYQVKPYRTLWLDVYVQPDATFDRDPYINALQQSTSMAWEDGQAWARGVAAYCRSICEQFTKPDVTSIKRAVEAMHSDVLNQMVLTQVNDNWASLGDLPGRWTGQSSTAFSNFYDNYNDVHARVGRYLAHANTGFAAAAKIINATQLGAMTTAEETVKALKAQLANWAKWDMEPPEPSDLPAWVGDLATTVKDAFALAGEIPGAGDVIDVPNTVIGARDKAETLLKDIEKLTGKDILPEHDKLIEPKSAEEVYTGVTEALYNTYLTPYLDAMGTLSGGGAGGYDSGALVRSLNSLSSQEWNLPQVKDASMKDVDDDW